MSAVAVETEANAVPIVRIVAAMLRRSLRQPTVAGQIGRVRGVVALRSATDPQAATMRIGDGRILVERGVATDVDVTITTDLADGDARPKVAGAARHPVLALAAAKLLEPPVGSWETEAERFLSAALRSPQCPRPVRLVCTDDGTERQWGGDGHPTIEIHGPAARLAPAMAGSAVMIEEVLTGRLAVVGDLRELSLLSRFGFDHLFGEL